MKKSFLTAIAKLRGESDADIRVSSSMFSFLIMF